MLPAMRKVTHAILEKLSRVNRKQRSAKSKEVPSLACLEMIWFMRSRQPSMAGEMTP